MSENEILQLNEILQRFNQLTEEEQLYIIAEVEKCLANPKYCEEANDGN